MKWFEKHTNDRNRLDSKLIKRKFGLAGYGMYEQLQQIAAENMEGDEISEWGLVGKDWTMEKLAEEIGCTVEEFRAFVSFCDDNLILEKRDDRLFVPVVLERMNEYAKRQFRRSTNSKNKEKLETPKCPDTSDNTDSTDISATQHNTTQHITSQELNTGSANARPAKKIDAVIPIQSVLESKAKQFMDQHDQNIQDVATTGTGITKSWQDKGFRYADALHINLTPDVKGRWLKVFKQAYEGRNTGNLERAYSYLVDYQGNLTDEEKLNFFFHIYENGLKERSN
jgi:hypothetical protein